jgi:aspartyl-tRNA(Asn)/glutamyl-tRNA(Gln) amidotransferase subunit A
MSAHLRTAQEIAAAVQSGAVSASTVVASALDHIAAADPTLGAFTDVTAERARSRAAAIDIARAAGAPLGPLAGVPFAAKNLFNIAGLPTRAGSLINRDRDRSPADATLIQRLENAGAVLVGGLNMGEYAYDFTGENAHDGPSRNPHDPAHMAGGSSGGSGTAVASGMVPLALGSDTNGSIRVPSSFCGLFGLKPTYGRLSRHGSFPFVSSLDHLGPFARSVADLALAYDVMQGEDRADPMQARRAPEPVAAGLSRGLSGLRLARLGGYFAARMGPEAEAAMEHIGTALGLRSTVEFPEAELARAAAYLITTTEGAALHRGRLRQRPDDFDPDVRDRLLAGAMVPAIWVAQAHKFRRWFQAAVRRVFEHVDVVIAPATPCAAPLIGQKVMRLGDEEVLVRPNIGIYTQPISFIGLPVCAVPVWLPNRELPIGVQVIAPPWREDLALRVALHLERAGAVSAPIAPGIASAGIASAGIA